MPKVVSKVPEEVKVRKLSQRVYEALKIRAARNGRSLGAEMANIITEAIDTDAASKLATRADKIRGIDSLWELLPGRMYECTAGLSTYRICLMQSISGSHGQWIYHIESLVGEGERFTTWERVTNSSQLASQRSDPGSSLQAALQWIKTRGSTANQ